MNLPPDKARLLRQYDNEKKWELICDQVRNIDAFVQEIIEKRTGFPS